MLSGALMAIMMRSLPLFIRNSWLQPGSHGLKKKKIEIPSTYTDTWRKINNVPDSDAIEAPAEFEGRESRKRGS